MEASVTLNQRLHGYQTHVIPQLHEDLHPYLSPKKEKQTGVYRSFDEILVTNIKQKITDDSNTVSLKIEGLLVLNEKASTQEVKMEMIEEGFVEICIDFLNPNEITLSYESIRLLGSLCSFKAGRDRLTNNFNTKISSLLNTGDTKLLNAIGWSLNRISSGRDGTDFLIAHEFVFIVAKAVKHNLKNYQFLERMLFVLVEMTQIDTGIESFCTTGCFDEFLNIINCYNTKDNKEYCYSINIIKKIVEVMSCMTMNPIGRNLFIKSNAIPILDRLLDEEDDQLINSTLRTLMFATLDINGKRQLFEYNKSIMLAKIIKLLSRYFEIRDN